MPQHAVVAAHFRHLASLALVALLLAPSPARGAPSVWAIDDGEKIRRDATSSPFEAGVENPVWRPGEPVRLFAMRNESVSLQVVVEADDTPVTAATVSLPDLNGPNGARMVEGNPARPGGPQRPIERFIEQFVVVRRASGGRTPGESLGWEKGAGPASGAWVGPVPDALVPVELASAHALYPLRIEPHSNGIVWIDLNIPGDEPPGRYRGMIEVRDGPRPLASIPVELEVAEASLPDRTVATMLFYDPEELARRVGPHAEESLWKLLHAHRIAPLHDASSVEDVRRQRDALDGTLYTRDRGYEGPAIGLGDGVLSLGAYGALGKPDDRALAVAAGIADAIARANLFDTTDVFLYAADEQCGSPWGNGWRSRLRGAPDANVRRVRVGWTCSDEPASQPVDIAILHAAYDVVPARAARDRGKSTWVYNGVLPHTGTFLLDADAVSPRVNGWLGAIYEVPRWFYWESTYWYGQKGAVPIDPFVEPESLHNDDGDWANGDGVLLYPGRQLDRFQEHSFGFEGVFASIRLKNWRRGIEDAGYVQLARGRDRARADAVTRLLIPAAFAGAPAGGPPSWGVRGASFFEARRALLAIVLDRREGPPTRSRAEPPVDGKGGRGWQRAAAIAGIGLTLLAAALAGLLWRRLRGPGQATPCTTAGHSFRKPTATTLPSRETMIAP